jgi:hypothetical protein
MSHYTNPSFSPAVIDQRERSAYGHANRVAAICPGPSLTRASVPAAKVADPSRCVIDALLSLLLAETLRHDAFKS